MKKILLIDDSQVVRSMIKAYLVWHQYEFIEAADAVRGWGVLTEGPVDLVIVDVNMPGPNGVAFVRRVRASTREAIRNVPIILLTGEKGEEVRAAAMQAGASTFVRKPVGADALLKMVQQLVG